MRSNPWQIAAHPFVLAAVLTTANAAKPVVVDDTAYLLLARQIAAHPGDPYGFEMFWYAHPEPAMQVLAPPVLPYWLAGGMALFGENLFLLKLGLFPFALAYCYAGRSLLRRFARGLEQTGTVLLTMSPFLFPLFNFMLDVPALALGLASVAVFVSGCDRQRFSVVVLAGVLAGVAAQTKYTMLTLPVVLIWYGIVQRRVTWAIVATTVAAAVFATWEGWIAGQYGTSHFLYHVRDQQASAVGTTIVRLAAWVEDKSLLFTPLVGHLGGLAAVWALVVGRALGLDRRILTLWGILAIVGWIAVAVIPAESGILVRNRRTGNVRLDLASLVFLSLGWTVIVAILASVKTLAFRVGFRPWRCSLHRHRATWFLLGWLGIEVGAYFVLTPFPAARRVMTLCVVAGLLVCRLASRVGRRHPSRRPGWREVAFGVGCGVGLMAADIWDALPERSLAVAASRAIGHREGGTVWFQGHWGWQYYCDHEGMMLVAPGRSRLRAGDWLVVPVLPDAKGFYRPYHGGAEFTLDPEAVALKSTLVWDDLFAGETVPALYGGPVPFRGRNHPRLRVAVYRVIRDWIPVVAHHD